MAGHETILIPPELPSVSLVSCSGFLLPGRGVLHATHTLSSALFTTIHISQDQEPAGGANCFNNDTPSDAGGFVESNGLSKVELLKVTFALDVGACSLNPGSAKLELFELFFFVCEPGLAAPHATHILSDGLLLIMQVSHDQEPCGAANWGRGFRGGRGT